ncbi:transient receptor potential cation channel protein painless-like [Chironomus tepperi]|uniref:transient receptor potential cation channel protein painless-like n=1 Tax=Chironomus tepperi TaxID=113505 RepID=UPI00391FBA42
MSHNIELYSAFNERNLGKFVETLEVYEANPNFKIDAKGCTLFEYILSTPNSGRFIEACIQHGADFNMKRNSSKYPLHFVIESQCIDNLKAVGELLSPDRIKAKSSPYANVKDSIGRNALHMLAEQLTNDSYETIFPMMKIVLNYGCNVNSQNDDGKTPFSTVAEKASQFEKGDEIVQYFVENGDALDEEATKLSEIEDFEAMLRLLIDGDINKFEVKFKSFKESIASTDKLKEYCSDFLEIAVENSLINIVDLLISNGIDVNRVSRLSSCGLPPIFRAYKNSNIGIFNAFFQQPNIKLYVERFGHKFTLLHHFFDEFKRKSNRATFKNFVYSREMSRDEKKCFDFLLSDRIKCNREYLNEKDEGIYSALGYSVQHKMDYMTIELLKAGAYVGPVISKIRKSVLVDLLDSCIGTDNQFLDDKDFEIKLNYGFLIPPVKIQKTVQASAKNGDTKLEIGKNMTIQKIVLEEMKPLSDIADDVELRRLVTHPVLSSFILLKWNKINFLVYVNLFMILFYMFTFIPFIYLLQESLEDSISSGSSMSMNGTRNATNIEMDLIGPRKSTIYYIFYILSCISLSLIIARESSQFFLSIKKVFDQKNPHQLRIISTIVTMLTVAQYFSLLGYLPVLSVSLHTKIFKKVLMTFLKSLAFYSILLFGFALSFHTLHGDKRNERYNNFYTIQLSVVKSFIMLTGELEASYVRLDGIAYKALFVLFVFLITIVLYNLLNALAVSDTQEIKSDAKLIDLCQRIKTMEQSEESVFQKNSRIGRKLKSIISLFPKTISDGCMTIKPNKGRYVLVRNRKICSNDFLPNYLSCLKRYVKIDEEIIQDMRIHILNKREERTLNVMRSLKENRYEKMANDIVKLSEMITNLKVLNLEESGK